MAMCKTFYINCAMLVLVFSASSVFTVHAEIVEYGSLTRDEVIPGGRPECPVCPPVQACDEGYSCQPDPVEPPTGEEQQYPTGEAEAWVDSIVGVNTLIDVSIDDPRWGGREPGEVYARENEDFLVWYWPHGGKASFNPTKLGAEAMWRDYRIVSGKSDGGGPMPITTGMEIFFSDSGGGISIFERVRDVQSPFVTGFLTPYVNPEQHKLPKHRIYPMGQKMMLSPWLAQRKSDLQDIKDHGFTMFGPLWDTRESIIEPIFQNAKKIGGLRAAHKINDGAGVVRKLCPKLDGGSKEEALWREVERNMKRAVNNPLYNDQIDVWLQGTEEISTRFHQCDKNKLLDYIQKFKKMVETHDPQKRPLWMSDVTGANPSQMAATHKWLDMVGPQMYIEGIGSSNHYKHNAIMNKLADSVVKTAVAMDASYPVMRPRAKTGSLGALYEPTPSHDNLDSIRNHTMHDMFLGFNRGMNGFQFYSWYNYTGDKYSDKQTFNWYKTAYKESVKLLTDNGLDYVYLWGDRRGDLTLETVSGPDRIAWRQGIAFYDYPSISMANIQYGNYRYVGLTNSATQSVQVKISGFPKSRVKILDIRSGKYLSNVDDGYINPKLKPLDVKLYRVEEL